MVMKSTSSSLPTTPALQITIPDAYPPPPAHSVSYPQTTPALQITIPDGYPPQPAHLVSSPSSSPANSSWAHPYPSSREQSSTLPSPVSPPKLVEASAQPHLDAHDQRDSEATQDAALSTQEVQLAEPQMTRGSLIFPAFRCGEPSSPGVASLVELAINTPSRTDLMGEIFRAPSPVFPSPLPSIDLPPHARARGCRRSLLSISTKPISPPQSPPSATALSSPIMASVNPKPSNAAAGPSRKSSSASKASSSSSQRSYHAKFYLRDEMLVLDVEGLLYKVHRHLLERNSDFFCNLLKGQLSQDRVMGGSDDTAISLPDVTRREFDCLLDFLYNRVFDDNDAVSLEEWTTLLDVSTRLRFSKIRTRAIREITAQRQSLSAVEIIVLAIRHDVPGWLAQAYADLCRRPYPLDELEAERLGARITARVGRARENILEETYRTTWQKRYGSRYTPPDAPDEELISRVVNDVFWPGDASHSTM